VKEKRSKGQGPTPHLYQVEPPYCLCRLAIGTALGFGVVDYGQKKSVFEKCTLSPPGDSNLHVS